MTNQQMNLHTFVVVRDVISPVPYWAIDESLPKVKARFKRLTGKFPSKRASIVALTGDYEYLEKVFVNDLGDISYPKELTLAVIQ